MPPRRITAVSWCQHVARHPGPLGAFFRRLSKRKPRHVAVVALARKVVIVAYHMLKNNEPYRYAQPKLVATKFTKLRAHPTQPQRGSHATSLQPAARAGLAIVYQQAGLPQVRIPTALPDGERRMLAARKLTEFEDELYAPPPASAHRPPRTRKKSERG